MKFAALLIALACPLQAELFTVFETSLGNVQVALQYQKAPQAVANFITLAQATRSRIDPATGAVIRSPLYIGEKFFRVVNDAGFKIAQTGSGTGTNSGGPGFSFKDEFDTTLTHVPYVLSMANSGPNSNGSQIFFTGNSTITSLDNVHTVFGLVTDAPSRAIIDAIHAAGSNGSTITGVSFSRTDPLAVAFDEHAQNLPFASQARGNLQVTRNVAATWIPGDLPETGDLFRAFRSTTLGIGSWSEIQSARRHYGLPAAGSGPDLSPLVLDTASAPSAFYHLPRVKHPGAVTPASFANRTVTLFLGDNRLSYAFDASGIAGTTTYTPAVGTPIIGNFTAVNPNNGLPLAPSTEPHSFTFTADTPALNPQYIWVKAGCDTADSEVITGHQSSQSYGTFGWQPFNKGKLTITR